MASRSGAFTRWYSIDNRCVFPTPRGPTSRVWCSSEVPPASPSASDDGQTEPDALALMLDVVIHLQPLQHGAEFVHTDAGRHRCRHDTMEPTALQQGRCQVSRIRRGQHGKVHLPLVVGGLPGPPWNAKRMQHMVQADGSTEDEPHRRELVPSVSFSVNSSAVRTASTSRRTATTDTAPHSDLGPETFDQDIAPDNLIRTELTAGFTLRSDHMANLQSHMCTKCNMGFG